MNAIVLNISNTPVRQDSEGRYNLNDLHKASGGLAKNKPSEWLRNKQTIELIAEIEKAGIPAIQSKQQLGTFAVKDLVYAYAMWISPAFTLKVIHAYDSLVSAQYGLKQLPEPPTITKAQQGELFTLIANKARSSGKPNAYYWSRFQNHFKLSSYKLTPADKFDEAFDYLNRLEGENNPLLTLSQTELNERITECVKAMTGELLPKQERLKYHAPKSDLKMTNKVGLNAWMTYPELKNQDCLIKLLRQLKADGNDVEGALAEFRGTWVVLNALYQKLDLIRGSLKLLDSHGMNVYPL